MEMKIEQCNEFHSIHNKFRFEFYKIQKKEKKLTPGLIWIGSKIIGETKCMREPMSKDMYCALNEKSTTIFEIFRF